MGPTPPFLVSKTVIFSLKFPKAMLSGNCRGSFQRERMHQLQEIMFLLILREDDFNSYAKKMLSATRSFLDFKTVIFSLKLRRNVPIRHLW